MLNVLQAKFRTAVTVLAAHLTVQYNGAVQCCVTHANNVVPAWACITFYPVYRSPQLRVLASVNISTSKPLCLCCMGDICEINNRNCSKNVATLWDNEQQIHCSTYNCIPRVETKVMFSKIRNIGIAYSRMLHDMTPC